MAMIDLAANERRIIGALLDDAAAAGLLVSVFDGEQFSCQPTDDQTALRLVIGDTDETTLRFRDPRDCDERGQAGVVGSVWSMHGNGCDVISDYSDNEAMRSVVARASALADAVSA